jgi:hypothetical protein
MPSGQVEELGYDAAIDYKATDDLDAALTGLRGHQLNTTGTAPVRPRGSKKPAATRMATIRPFSRSNGLWREVPAATGELSRNFSGDLRL